MMELCTRWKRGAAWAVVAGAIGISGGLATPARAEEGTKLTSAPTEVTLEDGTKVRVEAGELSVPESRKRPTSRLIVLPFYRLRSESPTPAPPVFLLAGGPGSSWLDQFRSAEGYREVAFYRTFADVVLFDQRGGGHSKPALTCPQTARLPAGPGPLALDLAARKAVTRRLLAECRDHWRAEGVDLAAYNTVENAADVNDLRLALGYGKVSLVGGSYGSHLALQVMRQFPEAIERALLFGIEGPDHTWDDPAGALATLRRIAARSERAPELAGSIPEGGLLAALARVVARLEKEPQIVTVKEGDEARTVRIDADLIRLIARHRAGRRTRASEWPERVAALDRGDYTLPARAVLDLQTVRLDDPMHYSMDCASGVSPERRKRYRADPARGLLGDLNWEYESLCDLWPAEDLGDSFRAGVVSGIPTVLIHGTWDTSTPIENAREVWKGLRRGRLVEVDGGNHGALSNLYERWPLAHERVRAFLTGQDAPFPATVDDSSVIQFQTPAPPPARPAGSR